METNLKLSRQEKTKLIWKYLKSVIWLFAAALTCACLANVFHALTPQIIKITVDSIWEANRRNCPPFCSGGFPSRRCVPNR